jgi:signal peptidase I
VPVTPFGNPSERYGRSRARACLSVLLWLATTFIALSAMVLAFLTISPSYHAYLVTSESMKPAVNMGDLVIVGPPNGFLSSGISPGTIVTYRAGSELITHRVQSVEDGLLVTRGDAVDQADSGRVSMSQVVGVVMTRIPKVGYLFALVRGKVALFLVAMVSLWVALAFVFSKLLENIFTQKSQWRRARGKRNSASQARSSCSSNRLALAIVMYRAKDRENEKDA